MRQRVKSLLIWTIVLVSWTTGKPALEAQPAEPLNVLLIMSDDMRSVPSARTIRTPNLERLAARGMTFARAYTQQPSCNASRASLLMGLRPGTTGIDGNEIHYRALRPDAVTLPQAFLAQGYVTASVGKVFHNQHLWRESDTWLYESFPHGRAIGRKGRGRRVTGGEFDGDRWRAARGADTDQSDGAAAQEAVRLLSELRDRPFFIAVGFVKPHTPYRAPRSYFRSYKLSTFPDGFDQLPAPSVPATAIPNAATAAVLEAMTDDDRRELMRGYHASATFVDAQVGVILDALDALDLWKNTVVVFTSDHGYHLGEHGWWGKNTLFEESLRVPLLMHVPTVAVAGKVSQRPVELLDLFPTLAGLAGVEAPPGLEGRDLLPLLKAPARPWGPAFSQTSRFGGHGYSVRDDRWRYSRWSATGETELYDLRRDPRQKNNLAGLPELIEVENRLSQLLDDKMSRTDPASLSAVGR